MSEFDFKEISPSFDENKLYRLDYLKGIRLEANRFQSDFKVASIIAIFSELNSKYQTLFDLMSLKNKQGFSIGADVINKQKGQIEVPFDISLLPHIAHGSIWNHKRKINNVTSYMRVNDTIEINPHSGKNIHICQLTQTHIFGNNDSFSNAIEFSEATVNGVPKKVYLPTMELIRFYFSGGSYFNTQLFHGGFNPENFGQLFSNSNTKFDKKSSTAYIRLNRNCLDLDSKKIANALANNLYMKAIRTIYSSINLGAKYNYFDISPKTHFPYEEKFNLEGLGKNIKLSSSENEWGYLLLNITNSFHKSYVKKIEIVSVDSYSSNPDGKIDKKIKAKKAIIEKNHKEYLQNQRPANDVETQELLFNVEPEIANDSIEIEKILKVSDKEEISKNIFLDEPQVFDKFSSLPGDGKNDDVAPSETNGKRESNIERIAPDKRIDIVSTYVKSLENQGVVVTPLPSNNLDSEIPYGLYAFGNTDVEKNTNSNSWCFKNNGERRRALFLKLQINSKEAYLLEMEGKRKDEGKFALYLLYYKKSEFYPLTFLNAIVNNKGRKLRQNVFQKSFEKIVSIKHLDNNKVDSFGSTLRKKLSEALGILLL